MWQHSFINMFSTFETFQIGETRKIEKLCSICFIVCLNLLCSKKYISIIFASHSKMACPKDTLRCDPTSILNQGNNTNVAWHHLTSEIKVSWYTESQEYHTPLIYHKKAQNKIPFVCFNTFLFALDL